MLGRIIGIKNASDSVTERPELLNLFECSRPLRVEDLDKTHAPNILRAHWENDHYTNSQDMFDMVREWAKDYSDDIWDVISWMYDEADHAYKDFILARVRIRLSYVILSLVINSSVHIPSAICMVPSNKDLCAMVYMNCLLLRSKYFPVLEDGVAYDYSGKYTKRTLISFDNATHPGTRYHHITLSNNMGLGTPCNHIRFAQPQSYLSSDPYARIPEYLSAPYKFNPKSYNTVFDLFVYPVNLLDEDTKRVIYTWLYYPNRIWDESPTSRRKLAPKLPYGGLITNGKYDLPLKLRSQTLQLPDVDIKRLSQYFNLSRQGDQEEE